MLCPLPDLHPKGTITFYWVQVWWHLAVILVPIRRPMSSNPVASNHCSVNAGRKEDGLGFAGDHTENLRYKQAFLWSLHSCARSMTSSELPRTALNIVIKGLLMLCESGGCGSGGSLARSVGVFFGGGGDSLYGTCS